MRPPVAKEPGRSLFINNYINKFTIDNRMPRVLAENSIQSRCIFSCFSCAFSLKEPFLFLLLKW
jgi:hypothetical protein